MDIPSGHRNFAHNLPCGHARIQNALLEPRRRGTGACRRNGRCGLHGAAGRHDVKRSAHRLHGDSFRRHRRTLGRHSGVFQGKVQYQRDAVYPHDELCCNANCCIFLRQMGKPRGLLHYRRYQCTKRGRLAAAVRQQVPARHPGRSHNDRAHIFLS